MQLKLALWNQVNIYHIYNIIDVMVYNVWDYIGIIMDKICVLICKIKTQNRDIKKCVCPKISQRDLFPYFTFVLYHIEISCHISRLF